MVTRGISSRRRLRGDGYGLAGEHANSAIHLHAEFDVESSPAFHATCYRQDRIIREVPDGLLVPAILIGAGVDYFMQCSLLLRHWRSPLEVRSPSSFGTTYSGSG